MRFFVSGSNVPDLIQITAGDVGNEMKKMIIEELLTPAEAAAMLGVDPKTVTRYAKAGKLKAQKTLGGHRRYRLSEVRRALLEANRV